MTNIQTNASAWRFVPSNGEMQQTTDNLYLNVGMLHDYSYDKSLVLQRARRGVKALGLDWGDLVSRNRLEVTVTHVN